MKKFAVWSVIYFFISLFLIFVIKCSKKEKTITIKAAHVTATDHPFHLGLLKFKEIVEQKSENKINVKIYPSTQLGNERDIIEGLQMGTIQISPTANAPLSAWVQELMVFDLPYLFRDRAHAEKVLNGSIGSTFAEKTEKFGIKILAFWTAGTRNIFTKKPIHSIEDLQGLKIRVMENPIHIETFNLFGAQATPMASGEVFTALQQGIIDGAENDPNSFYTFGYWQITKFYSMTQHVYGPAPFMVSKKFYDSLSEDFRTIIQNAAIIARDYQLKTSKEITNESLKRLSENGVEIIYPKLDEFNEAAKKVHEKFKDKIDLSLVKKINAMK